MIVPGVLRAALRAAFSLSGAALACACGPSLDAAPAAGEAQPLHRAAVCAEGEAPTTVAVIGTRDDGVAFVYCTGTLVAPDVVLVAAHCITETNSVAQHVSLASDLRFLPGADAATRDATLAASVRVVRTAPHPAYDGGSHAHDVGLLFLERAIEDAPLGIVLEEDEAASVVAGAAVTFAGYGYDEEQVFGLKRCASATLGGEDDLHLFVDAAGGAPQGCNGDSGGGLVLDVDTAHARRDRVAGVASYTAPGCSAFTAFSDVRLDRDFLDEQMQDCSARAWCDVAGLVPASFFDPPPPPDAGDGGDDDEAPNDEDSGDGPADAGCAAAPGAPLGLALVALCVRGRKRHRRPREALPPI